MLNFQVLSPVGVGLGFLRCLLSALLFSQADGVTIWDLVLHFDELVVVDNFEKIDDSLHGFLRHGLLSPDGFPVATLNLGNLKDVLLPLLELVEVPLLKKRRLSLFAFSNRGLYLVDVADKPVFSHHTFTLNRHGFLKRAQVQVHEVHARQVVPRLERPARENHHGRVL